MTASFFGHLDTPAPDAILGLAAEFRADPRAHKIDLGVGVYRDETGRTPVMRAVKAAEARLMATQDSKSYLGLEGDMGFVERMADIVFGTAHGLGGRLQGLQTAGGTGALRAAFDLVGRARPGARVWMGLPTWANHRPLILSAGLEVVALPFFDQATQTVDAGAMLDALSAAQPGDVVLLQGCCHNPTGAVLQLADWEALSDLVVRRGLLPIMDLAYQGLGDGLDADAASTRLMAARVPTLLVAYSCDKNFGVYRERTGALWVIGADAAEAARARAHALAVVRTMWSMPPDHGAAVVRLVLEDAALTSDWRTELDGMRARIQRVRQALAASLPLLAPLGGQTGMFSLLPISLQAVEQLKTAHAIYAVPPGRINVAGLREDQVEALADAITRLG
jgi:aromatic-amino-acid transaminase